MGINLQSNRTVYDGLVAHLGHQLEIVSYGDGDNVALECTDCHVVLLDADVPDPDEDYD